MRDPIESLTRRLEAAEAGLVLVSNILSGHLAVVDALQAGLHGMLNLGAANALFRQVMEQQFESIYAGALGGSLNPVYMSRLEQQLDMMKSLMDDAKLAAEAIDAQA